MKKILSFTAVLLIILGISAYADAPDLVFAPTDGKYIYCNNHEFVRRSELADNSNENPKFLMNNEDMTADKYSMFVSHINHTEKRDNNNKITERGFDIEIDVLFRADEDTVIHFSAAGFEVPKNGQYWYNGRPYTYEDAWGCLNCWATYLQMPIRQLDSGITYSPSVFDPTTIEIKKGEEFWMSEILPNYSAVPFFRPMNLMADFEIKSGQCDIYIAALKSTGTLKDRSNFAHNAAFGSYDHDWQYKGVANSMNEVNANVSYTIDNNSWSGMPLPVKVYNQKRPDGNEITKWYTHLNPRADQWSGDICAESDMLAFEYYDPMKLTYYGNSVSDEEKDPVWHFDTRHADTTVYVKDYSISKNKYVPNYELPDDGSTDYGCNLGNYGVKVNYNISITNDGDLTRYFNYRLATSSNNVVYAHDSDGNLIDGYAICKGTEDSRVSDDMLCIELPAHKTTDFTVTVILTTNYPGGMQNEFVINDSGKPAFVYNNVRQEIEKDMNFDGREYYYWDKGELYIEDDNEHLTKINLSANIKNDISGNWNEYRLYWTGDGYMLKAGLYDGIPYYTVQDFFKTVYFLDENFNLKNEHKFSFYPTQCTSANGVSYVFSGSPMYSTDNINWKSFDPNLNFPCWNYGKLSATTDKNGKIYVSDNGIDFDKVIYQSFKGNYIDTVGNYYYYADNKDLYYSQNGIYWGRITSDAAIKTIEPADNGLIVDGEYLTIDPDNNLIVKANNSYLGFSNVPRLKDGVTYVPLRFFCEAIGLNVGWDNGNIIISDDSKTIALKENELSAQIDGNIYDIPAAVYNDNGITYIPLRWISEQFGYTVDIDNGIITIS